MPLKWEYQSDQAPVSSGAFSFADNDPPAMCLTIWPHNSLPNIGFVWFIGLTFAMFMVPLLSLLGTSALWGMLPFVLGTLVLVWYFLRRNRADASLHEVLKLWGDRVEITRHNPRKPDQHWHANPHWAEIRLLPEGGPVENYVTLRGNDRTVEIGAFLSPEERLELYGVLWVWVGYLEWRLCRCGCCQTNANSSQFSSKLNRLSRAEVAPLSKSDDAAALK